MRNQYIQKKIKIDNYQQIKNKTLQILIPSDNPLWEYELYDYRGLFCGYMKPTPRNPIYKNIDN